MPRSAVNIVALELGPFLTNGYIVREGAARTCWVFDPGLEPGPLLEHLAEHKLTVERVLLTHGHGDHIAGVGQVMQAYPQAIFTVPAGDEYMLADPQANMSAAFGLPLRAPAAGKRVRPGDRLMLGTLEWFVLDTAGHTPGGVSYHCPNAGVVIVGDALFAGSIGRTDLPRADGELLVAKIRRHLLTLDDDTRVLCGHGPETTIGAERASNPFLQTNT